MALWVEACPDAVATAPASCVLPVELVDVSAAVPFTLTSAHIANMGEAFAAGLFLVVSFWALGYAGRMILNVIKGA